MKIDGRCHCGEITIEARADPRFVVICHCTDCQTFSSAPYRVSIPVLPENFRVTGTPRAYRKRADSGNEPDVNFCGTRGTALFSARAGGPYIMLRMGVVRQRADLPPKIQGFCQSAQAWAMDIREIPLAQPARA